MAEKTDRMFEKKIVYKPEYGKWATNEGNIQLPIYRWFPYKEAFSKQLVDIILDANPHARRVLDPFAGVGTTLLVCKERGIFCVGLEASSMCTKIAGAKLMNYDLELLTKELAEVKSSLKGNQQAFSIDEYYKGLMTKAFSRKTFVKLMEIKNILENMHYRDFFLLALANASAKISFLRKDGAYLKPKKPRYTDIMEAFFHEVERMLSDLRKKKIRENGHVHMIEGDARNMPVKNKKFDLIITSPPYLKKEEYRNIYFIERFVMLHMTHERETKYFGYSKSKDVEELIFRYFDDMDRFARELHRVLNPGGRAYVIVSDACIQGKVVECCLRTAKMFEDAGLEVKKIYILNKRWCTKKRVIKTRTTNESLIFVERKDI